MRKRSISAVLLACIFAGPAGCRSTADSTTRPDDAGQDSGWRSASGEMDAAAKFLRGKWSRAETTGGLYFHFAGDGQFTTTFDNPKQADLSEFPEALRGRKDRFAGQWTVEGAHIVLRRVSGPDMETPMDEVRLSYEKINDNVIKIDGAEFRRGAFEDAPPAQPDAGSGATETEVGG